MPMDGAFLEPGDQSHNSLERVEHSMDAAPPAVTEAQTQPDHFSVLLVDDDPLYRESIVANLEEQGIKVAQFSDGGEAVKWLVEGHHCDVVLLDWNMPKVSGAEVLRKLRLLAFQIP